MAVTNYDERVIVGGSSTEPNPYTLEDGKTYTAVAYAGNGSVFYVESDGTVTGENVTFKENSATADDSKGAVIYNNNVLTLTNAAFTDNKTTTIKMAQGGAIYNSGKATITDTTFNSNKATAGGAIFNSKGTLEINGGTFSSNSAKYGGGMQNFSGGTVTITDTKFTGNNGGENGGAICNDAGSITITGATFSSNTASKLGGAIYNASTLNLADTTFSSNTAKNGGGAIYNATGTKSAGTVNLTGTVTLATASDTFYNAGTLNWDLTGGTDSYGSLNGYQYLTNASSGTLAITVATDQEIGSYTLATGDFSALEGKQSFTLTGAEEALTINGDSVTYNDRIYTLATNDNGTTDDTTDDKLVLVVASPSPSVEYATITVDGEYTYNGAEQKATITVELNGITLTQDADYTLTFVNNINAGTATVTVSGIGSYTGTQEANFTIAQKELTVNGTTATNKIYDGKQEATVTAGNLVGVVGSDKVTVSATGLFDDKNVGEEKTVDVTYELSGDAASNYMISADTATANITAKSLTVSGSAADGKVYDGTTDAEVGTLGNLSGVVDGDDVDIDTATGTFSDKNAGNGKAVTISYTLSGDDSSNYTVESSETVADIEAKKLTVDGTTAEGKTYDGTTNVEVTAGELAGAIDGDDIAVTATGSFEDKNAGEDKKVNVNYQLSGDDASNYTISADTTTASIEAKTLTVEGTTASSKVYDGTTDATVTAGSLVGVVGSDDVAIEEASGEFEDKDAGSDKKVTVSYTLTGEDASNYSVDSGETNAEIQKRAVTLTSADDTKEYDGTPLTNDTVTVSGDDGWLDGEGATYDVTGTQTEVGSSENTFDYTLNENTSADNYNITTKAGTLTVTSSSIPTDIEVTTDENAASITWTPVEGSQATDLAFTQTASSNNSLFVQTEGSAMDVYATREAYNLYLKNASESDKWSGAVTVPETSTETATAIVSDGDEVADIFFANTSGTWDGSYFARHVGTNDWSGTLETVAITGKNIISDTFAGSSDANILLLTDDTNGDALFVDDVYTAFPNEQQARLSQLDEIRAGAGDDLVDMTSQRFDYTEDRQLTIRGGSGNDTIWASNCSNQLFGDAGNDRIVGALGADVIVGGSGNDSMQGGGGDDIFCFCNNWGTDTVEQLSGGSVTLWFESGSEANWDEETMTYTDGSNSVTVTGVESVTRKYGSDETEQYTALLAAGAFMDESSDKIFDAEQKGVLAKV